MTRLVGFDEAMLKKRTEVMADPEDGSTSPGTAPLTEIWGMRYGELTDLQRPFPYATCSSSDSGMLIGNSPHLAK